jgi:hypothetical protein
MPPWDPWDTETAYLFPFKVGTYFLGGVLTLAFLAAIPWLGGAGSCTGAAVGSLVGVGGYIIA